MSIARAPKTTKYGADFFINVATVDNLAAGGSDFYTEALVATALTSVAASATVAAGAVLLRDMGKTIRVADGTIYQKVASAIDLSDVAYIKIAGGASKFASLKL